MEILHVKLVTVAMLFYMRQYLNLCSLVTRKENFYFNGSKTIVQITTKTHCWIYAFLPSHSASSTPLLGIPVPNNISWTTLCSDITSHPDHTRSQQWEVAVSEAKNK